MTGTGRFVPDEMSLRASLAWHAKVTKELQSRVLEAREYVARHSGDRELLAILDGDRRSQRLWSGIDTTVQTTAHEDGTLDLFGSPS